MAEVLDDEFADELAVVVVVVVEFTDCDDDGLSIFQKYFSRSSNICTRVSGQYFAHKIPNVSTHFWHISEKKILRILKKNKIRLQESICSFLHSRIQIWALSMCDLLFKVFSRIWKVTHIAVGFVRFLVLWDFRWSEILQNFGFLANIEDHLSNLPPNWSLSWCNISSFLKFLKNVDQSLLIWEFIAQKNTDVERFVGPKKLMNCWIIIYFTCVWSSAIHNKSTFLQESQLKSWHFRNFHQKLDQLKVLQTMNFFVLFAMVKFSEHTSI